MVQHFSWQQFLVASFILSLVWYGGLAILQFRKKITGIISGGAPPSSHNQPLPHKWEDETEVLPGTEIMGKAKLPQGMTIAGMADFSFVNDSAKEEQVGLVPDVLQEIKGVFSALAQTDGSKQDFFKLMAVVRDSYPRISCNPNIGYINEFLTDHAPFHLSHDELENLWD